LSIAVSASSVLTRMPEWPRINVLMRISNIARTTSSPNGLPTQTACVMIRLCCSSSSSVPSVLCGQSRSRQFVAQTMRAKQLVRVAAEAGSHAVGRLTAADLLGQKIRGALHALQAC
jgi:hypothetical protein